MKEGIIHTCRAGRMGEGKKLKGSSHWHLLGILLRPKTENYRFVLRDCFIGSGFLEDGVFMSGIKCEHLVE